MLHPVFLSTQLISVLIMCVVLYLTIRYHVGDGKDHLQSKKTHTNKHSQTNKKVHVFYLILY